jgi:glutathione peroxidase
MFRTTTSSILSFLLSCGFVLLCVENVVGDSHKNCEQWAVMGECDANPNYMLQNCATACEKYAQTPEYPDLEGIDSFFQLTANDIDGNKVNFERFIGYVTIIVNVASFCGYTESHYAGLVQLHREFADTGLVEIIAFPCNQFGAQEPEGPAFIKKFAAKKGVEFTMMEKIDVNGPKTHQVYQFLKRETGPRQIGWNFATYYVIDSDGNVNSYSGTEPMELKDVVLDLLEREL